MPTIAEAIAANEAARDAWANTGNRGRGYDEAFEQTAIAHEATVEALGDGPLLGDAEEANVQVGFAQGEADAALDYRGSGHGRQAARAAAQHHDAAARFLRGLL